MASVNQIDKALGGVEDLLFGQGTENQTRNGTVYAITKINGDVIPFSGDAATGNLVSVNAKITAVDSQVTTNTADIATNTADIATNTADIATNAAGIATAQADITTLQGQVAAIVSAKVTVGVTPPASPGAGDGWLDTSGGSERMYVFDGNFWVDTLGAT